MTRVNRNDDCPCGSGEKYKKCCLKKDLQEDEKTLHQTIDDLLVVLKFGLENMNSLNPKCSNIKTKKIAILNNTTIECQYYSEFKNTDDIRNEIGSIMGFIDAYVKDESNRHNIKYYAVRAFESNGNELIYAISSISAAKHLRSGNSIEWLHGTIFQENTKDYRLSIAKRQISEIESSLRIAICDRLSKKLGDNWFDSAIIGKTNKKIKETYSFKYGADSDNGNELIEYAYLIQLKAIIIDNWDQFSTLFNDKEKFTKYIEDLNLIRREEAHNRDIDVTQLQELKTIYEFLLINITKEYPGIIPHFLIDNWKIQIKEIMFGGLETTYSDSKIETESNIQVKLLKSLTNIHELINYLKDKETKLQSIVVPIQKIELHKKLVKTITDYRNLQEELINLAKSGNIDEIEEKQFEIESYKSIMDNFINDYVFQDM